jgi:hypothetical protein
MTPAPPVHPSVAGTAHKPPKQRMADPRKLAEELSQRRKTRPMTVMVGCLLVSFLCGAAAVGGVIAMIAIAHSLGWK